MKLIRVNMTNPTITVDEMPEAYRKLGGRALTSTLIYNEIPASSHPLGSQNKLVFAPGLLTGTSLINTSRLSVGAKSPLTGGIKESNVGGTVAYALARLGIGAVVIEGKAPADRYYALVIKADGSAELIDAQNVKGMRTYALVEKLSAAYGEHYSITCIGPAGDFQLSSASIQTTDLDGRPCRAAGRGGLGAVMGAKGTQGADRQPQRQDPGSPGLAGSVQDRCTGLCRRSQGRRIQQ